MFGVTMLFIPAPFVLFTATFTIVSTSLGEHREHSEANLHGHYSIHTNFDLQAYSGSCLGSARSLIPFSCVQPLWSSDSPLIFPLISPTIIIWLVSELIVWQFARACAHRIQQYDNALDCSHSCDGRSGSIGEYHRKGRISHCTGEIYLFHPLITIIHSSGVPLYDNLCRIAILHRPPHVQCENFS